MAKVPKKTEQKPHELSDEALDNLVRFFDVLIEMDMAQKKLKNRLVKELKGFAMPGEGRSCSLCDRNLWDEDGWYDKWGLKCMNCQSAVDKRKIPGSLCGDWQHEKSIPDTALAMQSGLHVQTIRKLIRQGKIAGRQIPGGPYMILRKDNPNLKAVLASPIASSAH